MHPVDLEGLNETADLIAGVFHERVVSVFSIRRWRWETDAERVEALRQGYSRDNPRVVFEVENADHWASLIGKPNPGRPFTGWWPVQFLDTTRVRSSLES